MKSENYFTQLATNYSFADTAMYTGNPANTAVFRTAEKVYFDTWSHIEPRKT